MYQSNTHTAAYRGNMQGHDNSWRADSQQPSSFGATGFVQSQYQGNPRAYQPTGNVQSFYGGQSQSQSGYANPTGSYGITNSMNARPQTTNSFGGTQSFHTAQYHGHQQGHDTSLRADAWHPSNLHAGTSSYQTGAFSNQPGSGYQTAQYRPAFTSAAGGMGGFAGQTAMQGGMTGMQQQQMMNQANASMASGTFHTAQYQGNQQGHDQYLRSDSSRGSQFGYGMRS